MYSSVKENKLLTIHLNSTEVQSATVISPIRKINALFYLVDLHNVLVMLRPSQKCGLNKTRNFFCRYFLNEYSRMYLLLFDKM